MIENDKRYRTIVTDRRSQCHEGYGGHKRWIYYESRNVECRIRSGEVYRHTISLEETSSEYEQMNDLLSTMIEAEVHERTAEDMDENPYWEISSDDVWVSSNHTGRMGAGRYSYRATAGSREALLEWGDNLMRNYHPMGYGTHVRTPEEVEDGLWQCSASRAGSCD